MTDLRPEQGLDMAAFRPYSSPEDYILRSTEDIWRDRGIGRIGSDFYGEEVLVHSPYGTATGVGPVVRGTLMRISSYPTRFSKAEDVVWEARGNASFISSHRVFSTGTHLGWNQYGPATQKDFTMRALAHCLVRNGRVIEEWLVRDEHHLVTSLGYDPLEMAVRLAGQGAVRAMELRNVPEDPLLTGVSGTRPPDVGGSDDIRRIVELLETGWNQRLLNRVTDFVHPDVVLHTTRGRRFQGVHSYTDHIIDILSCIPDARIRVIDICVHDHPRRGRRAAVVWTLEGTYDGAPEYGPVTGGQVQILGSSQYAIEDGLVVEEFRVYDEMALMIQIEQGRAARETGGA